MQGTSTKKSIADAHIVLGWIAFMYRAGNWEVPEKHIKRAVMEPNSSDAHRGCHFLLFHLSVARKCRKRGQYRENSPPLSPLRPRSEALVLSYADYPIRQWTIRTRFWSSTPILVSSSGKGEVYEKLGSMPMRFRNGKSSRVSPAFT